jgi:hypothetical protein
MKTNKTICAIAIMCIMILQMQYAVQAQAPAMGAGADVKYKIVQPDGTNASAVTWIPGSQQYVTVIAGNDDFPMEGFNPAGSNTFATRAGFDFRGIWFNPGTGAIEGNCAGELGWQSMRMESGRVVSAGSEIAFGQNQPDFQSVGAFATDKKQIAFLDLPNAQLVLHKRTKPAKMKTLALDLSGNSRSDINQYTVGYTGHKGYEFVLLNSGTGNLLFFNRSGELTATLKLPADAPLNNPFGFSFANDRVFLYDKTDRIWFGYKVF